MAHLLDANKNTGKIPFAFTGPREAIWHGLGQSLDNGKNIDQWVQEAGFDWHIEKSEVSFNDHTGAFVQFPGRTALRRSDTQEPLSIVSDKFKVVQPKEVLEFFRDLVELHGMELSTAGIIQNGRAYWALANVGKEAEIVQGDKISGQLLLTTSVDGFQSTQAKFVSTRVVCNNTLQIALGGRGRAVRVTHKQDFDAKKVKIEMGLIEKSWDNFIESLRKLASKPMNETELRDFTAGMFYLKDRDADKQPYGVINTVESIIAKAKGGSGSEMHKGTRWGALCGVTEALTHIESTRMTAETKFISAYMGEASDKKVDAYLNLVMAA